MKIYEVTEPKSPVQEAIQRHINEGVPFTECMFRPGSDSFYEFYTTVKNMYREGQLPNIDWQDQELLSTDIGESIIVEGERIPLDVPMEAATPDTVKFTNPRTGDETVAYFVESIDEDSEIYSEAKEKFIPLSHVKKYIQAGKEVKYHVLHNGKDAAGVFDDYESAREAARKYRSRMKTQGFRAVNITIDPVIKEGKIDEAEYQGKDVELNKPKRGGSKKFYVYVRDPKTKNVKKVSWGDKGLSVKAKNPGAVRSFVARHKCKQKNDKTKAGYWACRTPRYKSLGVKGGQWW